MKISANRKILADVMGLVTAVVNPRHPNPAVQNVMFDVGAKDLTLRATDLEVSLQVEVPEVNVESKGKVLLPAAKLANLLKDLPSDSVSLETQKDTVILRTSRDTIHLQTAELEGFPGFPEFNKKGALTFNSGALERSISLTSKSIAAEKGRYALNGVKITPVADRVEFCGTDGRRLAFVGLNVKAKTLEFPVILPRRGIEVLSRVAARQPDSEILLDIRENEMVVKTGGMVVSTLLVEGQYPDYWSVIPRKNDKKVVVNRLELMNALRIVSHLTSIESQIVSFDISSNDMTLATKSFGTGSAEAKVAVTYDGPELKIGFDPRFVSEGLALMNKADVVIELKDPQTGAIFHEGDKESFFFLVMPLEVE